MKKITLLINYLLFSQYIHAVDYITPIDGAKTFDNGDTVTVTGDGVIAVKDSQLGSAGIHVNNNGAVNISSAGATTNAISLTNQVANDLGSGSSVSATSNTTGNAIGIDIRGKDTSLTASDLTVKTASGDKINQTGAALGFNVQDGATVDLKGNTEIITTNGSGIKVAGSTVDKTSFKADKVNIQGTGFANHGVDVSGNSKVDLGDGSQITLTGNSNAYYVSSGINMEGGELVAKNLDINMIPTTSSSAGGTGIYAKNAKVKLEGGSITTTNGSGVYADSGSNISIKNSTITNNAHTFFTMAIYAPSNAVVNLDKTHLNLINDNGIIYGLFAASPFGAGRAEINAHDLSITASGVGDSYGVIASTKGQITLTGNTNIDSNSVAIYGFGGGQVTTGTNGSRMTIKGVIKASSSGSGSGIVDLDMLAGSTFTGSTMIVDSATINLKMADTIWDMTDNSQVTDLTATNSTINFMSTAGNYHTLQVANLAGSNANFAMNVDLGGITAATNTQGERIGTAGVNGDLLTVTDAVSAGSYKLAIANNGTAATQGNEVLQVVATPNNNTGNFKLTGPVEAGAYEYGLRQSTNNSGNKTGWELYSSGRRTTTAEAATSFLNSNYLLSYIDTQTLLQRMGELRNGTASNKEGDFWIRGFGGKLNSFGGQQLSGFDMTYTGTQFGIDKQLASQLGQVYIGVMGGMTHANPDYRDGDGTTKDYHVGLYGTLMMDNGLYVDAVAKYTYMKNHFSVKDTQGNSVQGKGTSSGYNLSLETGKRFKLAAANQSGFYIEPQAQITYGHQGGMSINASNGLKVDLGNYNYTLGRISGIVGYEIAGANPVNIYIKSGYVREMDGSTSYSLNGQKSNYNARGGWWDNGIGVNAELNKRHNIYADINYAKGSRFDQQQLNVGYRYSF